jgi:hypothetical protein
MRIRLLLAGLVVGCAALLAFGQDTHPEPPKFLPPSARMAAAKTIFLDHLKGTDIPFNIIQAGFESWPRYTIVDSADKADLIVQVTSPAESSSGSSNSVSAKAGSGSGGAPQKSSEESQFAEIPIIKLTVLDARTRVVLYSATERTKNAWKEKNRTESQIETAQKMFDAFRKRIEPEATTPEKQ